MKISFATALAVGTTSEAEYMDFVLTDKIDPEIVKTRLNSAVPIGAEVLKIKLLSGKNKSLTELVNRSRYEIRVPVTDSKVDEPIKKFNDSSEVIFDRVTPKHQKTLDLKKYLATEISYELRDSELTLHFETIITPEGSIKPVEVLKSLREKFFLPIYMGEEKIRRINLTRNGVDLI